MQIKTIIYMNFKFILKLIFKTTTTDKDYTKFLVVLKKLHYSLEERAVT